MSESLSLYRRHRPGSFDEVVGQEHVVRTLRNAVEQDKVNHAYLFVGSRGTGKTSMAKILARSLNCERGGPTVTPCGECDSCTTIAAGTSVDVIEMDAASNRSVDDIRDLRERVAYAPSAGGWKVYILDEAHMLTKEAWNAFLKTLEEPPPNTVFVLATTEAHKVMATIADRCQRFDFQRPSLDQISAVLRRVAEAEGIEIEGPAVSMVARSASGSFRDALGTLDQLVAFNGRQIALGDVLEVLGAVDTDLMFEVVDAIAAEDPAAVLASVERLTAAGREVTRFARDLLEHLRALVLLQIAGVMPESLPVAEEDAERMRSRASTLGAANLFRTIEELAAALEAIRSGDEARMAVEIALIKAARPDLDPSPGGLARRVERLEGRLAGSSQPAAGSRAAAEPDSPPKPAEQTSALPRQPTAQPGQPTPPPEQPPAPTRQAPPASDGRAVSSPAATGAPVPPPAPDEAPSAPAADAATPDATASPPATDAAPPPIAAPEGSGPSDLSLEEVRRSWPAVLDQLRSDGQALLAALFDGTRPMALDLAEGTIEVGFPQAGAFNKRQAEEQVRRQALSAALMTTYGETLRPSFRILEDAEAGEERAEPERLDEDELLEKLKSEFNAREVN